MSRLADVHIVVAAAQQAGWQGRDGFHTALLLLAAGTSAAEAQEMFAARRKYVQ